MRVLLPVEGVAPLETVEDSVTLVDQLRARRRAVRADEARTLAAGLTAAAVDLRSRGQRFVDCGRPDLAAPYLDEATMFEAAMPRLVAL